MGCFTGEEEVVVVVECRNADETDGRNIHTHTERERENGRSISVPTLF